MNKYSAFAKIIAVYPWLNDEEMEKIFKMLELIEKITEIPVDGLVTTDGISDTFFLFYEDLRDEWKLLKPYEVSIFKDYEEFKTYVDTYFIEIFGGRKDAV